MQLLEQKRKRQECLKKILQAFADKQPKLKRCVYKINKSFRNNEINNLGLKERQIMQEKLAAFVQREKQNVVNLERQDQDDQRELMQQKLSNYGHLNHNQQFNNRSLNDGSKNDSKYKEKHIFIGRKYNSNIAFQLQAIIQAKRIQSQKKKLRQNLDRTFANPLVNNTVIQIRKQRGSAPMKSQAINGKIEEFLRPCSPKELVCSILKNNKIKQALSQHKLYSKPVIQLQSEYKKRQKFSRSQYNFSYSQKNKHS